MKVKLAGETVTSPVSEEDKSMTTEELGAVFKTTVNVSVVPIPQHWFPSTFCDRDSCRIIICSHNADRLSPQRIKFIVERTCGIDGERDGGCDITVCSTSSRPVIVTV